MNVINRINFMMVGQCDFFWVLNTKVPILALLSSASPYTESSLGYVRWEHNWNNSLRDEFIVLYENEYTTLKGVKYSEVQFQKEEVIPIDIMTVHFTSYNLPIDKLTSCSWALLQKPPIVQLFKNFPTFYETQRFITVLTTALHWSLFWDITPVHTTPSSLSKIYFYIIHPPTSWCF
jgi:hypothetical protein